MNKVKKVATSIGVFFSVLITKVYAIDLRAIEPISMYAVDPGPKARVLDNISRIGKTAIPVVLFVIGLFVVLSKKLTKKVKAIGVSILIILAILGYVLMKYIATNF